MFIDRELDFVTLLCCMTHVFDKFKDALSILYHAYTSTYLMMSISIQQYFVMFFSAIIKGSRDYANLQPLTIGIQLKY